MRRSAPLAGLLALALGLAACASPARVPDSRAEELDFERDRERCTAQNRNALGILDPIDFRSCMRARGWAGPPPEG